MRIESTLVTTDKHHTVLSVRCTVYGWRPVGVLRPALGFNGQYCEPGTGRYHLGHGRRVYNPVIHRFHEPDSFSPFDKGGVNAYAYCQADPVNFTDSSGRFLDLIFPELDPKWSAIFSMAAGLSVFSFNVFNGAKLWQNPEGIVGLTKVGFNVGLVGSATTFAGGVMQLAGVKEGRYVSAAGAGVTAIGAVTNTVPALQNIARQPDSLGYLTKGLGNRFIPDVLKRNVPKTQDWISLGEMMGWLRRR